MGTSADTWPRSCSRRAIDPAGGGRPPRRSIASLGRSPRARPTRAPGPAPLGPEATPDPAVAGPPADLAHGGAGDSTDKPYFLNTLGAALYRAGRYDEAIRRLEEGIRLQGGESLPVDWAFLAMAHHRLGHRAEARRWLDRLRQY